MPTPHPIDHDGRSLTIPVIQETILTVKLPRVLDGMNSRMLRRLIMLRLPECAAMRWDAVALMQIGDIGAATLWQVITMARAQGVNVTIANASQETRNALLAVWHAESERAAGYATAVAAADSPADIAAFFATVPAHPLATAGMLARMRKSKAA